MAEPEADVKVSENPSEVGGLYSWHGEVTGQGEVEHKSQVAPTKIVDEIRFLKPFKSVAQVSFDIEPVGDGARITWNMDGSMPWFLFWMIPMMKTFIGMDYERGLKMLKEWMETGEIQSQSNINGKAEVGPIRVAGIRKTAAMKDLGPSMGEAIALATEKLDAAGIPRCGGLISVYHKLDMKNQTFDYTTGFMIADSDTPPADMSVWTLPACEAFHVEHVGKYEHLGNAWSAANQHVRYKKMKQSKVGCFEIYRNSPDDTPEAELRTDVYLPLK